MKYTTVKNPARRTTTEGKKKRNRSVTIFYHVKNEEGKDVDVCASTFASILSVSKDRLQRLARKYIFTGQIPKENRGGRRKNERDEEQTEQIKRNILKYKCRDAHYSRRNTCSSY
ncbi:hypothetical protein ANN_09434 [Periplaneta americana]|uniref:Uncharacterized protein n=1 Tax=Periplaneta americana TaxID=6978 RepID=A0ABQ8TN24_PERAM|nr:hypothetical protein ANN_09434 [Periplaneta americana]